ncbi:MAG: hypothetical protein IPN63_08030 [Gammaproteobacteria bacterium]|nr:hypothetical protein [Gammaproteobacteria bacterium]
MTPELLLKTAIIPALGMLDSKLDTPAARAMLIAIALQETGLRARRQMLEARDHWWESKPGKGHGFWQFERDGATRGVMVRHAAASAIVLPVIDALLYPRDPYAVHEALIHNDVLACVLARALLYSVPDALPGPNDPEKGWVQYVSAWRPGKPHVEPWANNYRTAWATV